MNKVMSLKQGSFKANKEAFDHNIKKFRQSGKRNYDFITRAGKTFQNSVFKLCQRMIEIEQFPKYFQDTTLHMIFKGGKGRNEVLSDNRFIHSKPWFPRLMEGLVVEEGLREALLQGSSMYQVGGQPGHRTEELVFAMKSIVAKQMMEGKATIIQCWDISKFFDKERIEDAVLTCLRRGADEKAVRLWYNLNKDTKIQVKTGVGLSEKTEVGAVLGQGTIGGALISQAVLDDGIKDNFQPGGQDELEYGEVPLAPMMYQDDLIHGAGGLEEAILANTKIDITMKQRGLSLNEAKSVFFNYGI